MYSEQWQLRMRWAMSRAKPLSLLLIAISWILANTAWLSIGEQQLTGTEISQLLNLLPAISVLLVFIASYQRFAAAIGTLAAISMLIFAVLALTSDFEGSAAAIAIYESISGIQGAGPGDVDVATNQSITNLIAAASGIAAAAFLAISAFKPAQRSVKKRQVTEDNRALWDEQGD